MDDIRAVMDAEGIERAALVGLSDGASMCALFAATYPNRVSSLVLWAGGAGPPADEAIRSALLPWVAGQLGFGEAMAALVPWPGTPTSSASAVRALAMSPRMARALLDMNFANDIRPALPVISAPSLVVHRRDDPVLGRDRAIALGALIPGARRVELPGDFHLSLVEGDETDALDVIEEFLTGTPPRPGFDADRVLATVLFTDIVDSTPRAAALGDRQWRDLLDAHDRAADEAVDRHRGVMVRTTGDGVLARFDGPARAIRCAQSIVGAAEQLDLPVRAGLHVGEFQLRGDDVAGLDRAHRRPHLRDGRRRRGLRVVGRAGPRRRQRRRVRRPGTAPPQGRPRRVGRPGRRGRRVSTRTRARCRRWDSNPHWRVPKTRASAVGLRRRDRRAYGSREPAVGCGTGPRRRYPLRP